MLRPNSAAIARDYALVVLSVALSTLARFALNPLLGKRVAFITFFPALVFSAWVGGWGGGLVALALSTLAATYYFLPPSHALLIATQTDFVSLLIFIAVGLSISAISSSQRKARQQSEEARQQAQDAAASAQRSEQALRESEARYRLLLETANEGVLSVNAEDRISYVNPRFAEMVGYPPEELQGRPIFDILFPEDREKARERREQRRQGVQEQYELRLRRHDGTELWTLANVSIERESDQYSGTFSLITDITDRKKAEMDLAAAYRREALLNQIGNAIRGTTDPDQIQTVAVQALGKALGADRTFYNVYDLMRDSGSVGQDFYRTDLVSLAGDYRLSDLQDAPVSYYPDGKTLVIPDTQGLEWPEPLAAALQATRVRSVISVPLFDAGTLVGTLTVAMADTAREWTEEEAALVEAVAVQTRAALEARRLQQREHRIAQQLQDALQPAIPVAVPGLELGYHYRPALAEAGVGGDFADVFGNDKGVSYLVVGDLSGKGLAAASQVAIVRHMLRYALYNGRTLAGPVSSLNRTLAENNLLTGFATLFVARYDAETRRLSYVNCGQDAGLILRADTQQLETLPPTGPVLGAIQQAEYEEQTAILEAGDTLALYTDGLSEAGATRKELLTGDGVAALLQEQSGLKNARSVVARLIAGVDAYAQGGVSDDQCLLVAIVEKTFGCGKE